MIFPRIKKRDPDASVPEDAPGVYVTLDDLIRLQFKARGFSFLPRQPIHSLLAGRHASRLRGRGLNFEEIRNYLPGDDVRAIDWKVTARTREPHTRVYTEERERSAIIVVDQRINMFYGTQVNLKSVTAAEAAAISAWRVVDQGDQVGALVFNDREQVEFRPRRSKKAVMHLLEAVVRMNRELRADAPAGENPNRLNEMLERVARRASHDHLIVIISDFDGADDDTRRLLTRLHQRNDLINVVVHDPSATDFPLSKDLVVTDGELQVELQLEREKVRKKLSEFASGRVAELLRWQHDYGIIMMPITTAEGVAEQIQRLLGRRVK